MTDGRAVTDLTPIGYVRTLVLAALLGVPVAFAAVLFQTTLHWLIDAVWEELPEAFGWDSPAWWYVLLVPAVAGVLVAWALRLPGHGGHKPLDGLGVDPTPPIELPSILLAALLTLGLGLVLGPEAPLIALGTGLGLVATRVLRREGTEAQLLVSASAFAAIATLFGGPLPAAFLLFEVTAAGARLPAAAIGRALLPGFVAAGTGALVFIGVGDWPGLRQQKLSLPPLPAYPNVRIVDIAWCLLLAAAVAVAVVFVQRAARVLEVRTRSRSSATVLVLAGLTVGALAVAFRAAADRPVDLVLFSGQASLPEVVAESSAGVLALLLVAKALAYGLSLGAGFRGGPVFPALILGIASGALAAIVLPGLALAPAIAAGTAASAAAAMRFPFFAVLMAAFLVGSSAIETVPIAIFAAAVGWLVATATQPSEG